MDRLIRLFFPIVLAFLFLIILVGCLASLLIFRESQIRLFIDVPSIIFVVGGSLLLTGISFERRDFGQLFTFLFRRDKQTVDWFRLDYFWLCVVRNLLIYGAFGTIIGCIALLNNVGDLEKITAGLSVAILTMFYSVVFSLVFPIPALIYCRLNKGNGVTLPAKRFPQPLNIISYILTIGLLVLVFNLSTDNSSMYADIPSYFGTVVTVIAVFLIYRGSQQEFVFKKENGRLDFNLFIILGIVLLNGLFIAIGMVIFSENNPLAIVFPTAFSLLFSAILLTNLNWLKLAGIGSVLTVALVFFNVASSLYGLISILFFLDELKGLGPYVALNTLTSLYALIGLIFFALPMEDRVNLQRRQMDELSPSRLLWYIFPILAQFILFLSLLVPFLHMSGFKTEFFDPFMSSMQTSGLKPAISMILIWILSFFIFLVGLGIAQIGLLYLSFDRLKRTQEQLVQSEKMASLGQLVAGVAHEINNPVNFIRSNIAPLSDYLESFKTYVASVRQHERQLPEEIQQTLREVYEQNDLEFAEEDSGKIMKSLSVGSERIAKIVADLRHYSRSDKEVFSKYDLHEAIDSTLTLLENQYKHHVTVYKSYCHSLLVDCMPGKINQVFMNLLANAEQAIEGEGNVWITTHHEGSEAVIHIRDDGKGISPENQAKIFDPFYTTKAVGKGTGLGLSIVQGIIKQHGGSISVHSDVGQGTMFTIRLPIKRTG